MLYIYTEYSRSINLKHQIHLVVDEIAMGGNNSTEDSQEQGLDFDGVLTDEDEKDIDAEMGKFIFIGGV